MSKKNKMFLYSMIGLIGLIIFILQIFVFAYPDGIIGYFLCLFSIYMIFGSIIKLWIISSKFKNSILSFLDILFWLP